MKSAVAPGALRIVGESSAGHGFEGAVQAGQAVRIFTGAAMPDGCDSIVIQEDASRDGDQVVIRVIDSGPGLPPDQAARVFERFWRSDSSRARTSGGSGLGLAIVASIVAAHGGSVRFDSSVEGGSTVTVALPAR